nr:unnamed protein product [Ananas comosus var. bracteatus]
MASHYQAALLVASPSYPNSIAWSNENLVAIASGHIITILNPALHAGPRGLITLHPDKPFPIGVVDKEDLLSPCLMPTSLSRDVRPCARSISWSQPGFASNSGCLLAVCTTGGHVKLYRAPFCEFTAEWIEVVDISELLFKHLESTEFGEHNASEFHQKQASTGCTTGRGCAEELEESLSSKGSGRRKRKTLGKRDEANEEFVELSYCSKKAKLRDKGGRFAASYTATPNKVIEVESGTFVVNDQSLPSRVKGRSSLNGENNSFPLITAKQYASRSALLSSLVVAWSPVVTLCGSKCAILAVGAKSGNISFWKSCTPQCYTVEHDGVPADAILIGLLQAHSAWITAISWGVATSSCSKSQLAVATGSCDGSVKIWLGDVQRLVQSTEATNRSFSLLTEVTNATSAPVSTISLIVQAQSQDKIILAIGRGSGSLETWIYCLSSNKIQCAGISEAHDQVVTGLAWAFDGHCLYSCSQLSQVSDQCFGLALAPGELMVAVVRSLETNLLNQMYQARTQRAVVEFFWTGGQLLEPLEKNVSCGSKPSELSKRELQCWECNILWSLKNFENGDKLPVLWDTIAALLVLKKLAPTFVRDLLSKWISSWFPEKQESGYMEKTLLHVQNMLSVISSRRIHLLNIISRRLMPRKEKAEVPKWEQHNFSDKTYVEGETELWHNFLVNSERELTERLVASTFTTVLSRAALSPDSFSVDTSWFPIGVAQMEQWVAINSKVVHNQLKVLGSKFKELGTRIDSVCEYSKSEVCSFCTGPVQFKSPDVASCEGRKVEGGEVESHKLSRCAVSMKLCSITEPMWFCCCCNRWINKLAPQAIFTMPSSPLDVNCGCGSFDLDEVCLPLCPFCGILLQRSMPEFLLSVCPV